MPFLPFLLLPSCSSYNGWSSSSHIRSWGYCEGRSYLLQTREQKYATSLGSALGCLLLNFLFSKRTRAWGFKSLFFRSLLLCCCLVTKSCPTLCDPMDYSLPQPPLFMGFSRQEYWSGLPFLSPGSLPEIEPTSPALPGRFFTTEPLGKPRSPFKALLKLPVSVLLAPNCELSEVRAWIHFPIINSVNRSSPKAWATAPKGAAPHDLVLEEGPALRGGGSALPGSSGSGQKTKAGEEEPESEKKQS